MVTITVFVFIWHIILYIRQRLKRRCKPQEPINLKKKTGFCTCLREDSMEVHAGSAELLKKSQKQGKIAGQER